MIGLISYVVILWHACRVALCPQRLWRVARTTCRAKYLRSMRAWARMPRAWQRQRAHEVDNNVAHGAWRYTGMGRIGIGRPPHKQKRKKKRPHVTQKRKEPINLSANTHKYLEKKTRSTCAHAHTRTACQQRSKWHKSCTFTTDITHAIISNHVIHDTCMYNCDPSPIWQYRA